MSDDTGDLHGVDKRLREVEVWQRLHARDHLSIEEKLNNAAEQGIKAEKQCAEIQVYLDERKTIRQRQANLLADLKRLILIGLVTWIFVALADGVRLRALEWLTR